MFLIKNTIIHINIIILFMMQVNSENVSGNAHQEYILDDDECPLAILMNHPSTRGKNMQLLCECIRLTICIVMIFMSDFLFVYYRSNI